ncbi:MAG: sigma-70 family RNA polymerase sigma factor [Eubacteriales bacterium]|nr:sigma-70 family RNA polymerase sigma factor [Eubacteriales bacterium]
MKQYQNYNDDELLLMSSSGDQDAEEELITRYKRKVSICARRFYLFGGDNDDLIQEGTIGLLKAIRTFDPGKGVSFSSYAEVCIRSKLLDAISFRKYSGFLSLDEPDLSDSSLCDNNPETLFIENEHYEEFVASLKDRLSAYERSVLDMYLQGMNYNELSEKLNKPVASVYNAVQRIRLKLSAHIDKGDSSK